MTLTSTSTQSEFPPTAAALGFLVLQGSLLVDCEIDDDSSANGYAVIVMASVVWDVRADAIVLRV